MANGGVETGGSGETGEAKYLPEDQEIFDRAQTIKDRITEISKNLPENEKLVSLRLMVPHRDKEGEFFEIDFNVEITEKNVVLSIPRLTPSKRFGPNKFQLGDNISLQSGDYKVIHDPSTRELKGENPHGFSPDYAKKAALYDLKFIQDALELKKGKVIVSKPL